MEKHWNDEHVRSQWAQFGEALHASQNLARQAQASTLCQLNHLAKFLPTPHGVNNPSLLLALVCRMRMGWVYSLDDYVTILALLQELNSLSLAEPKGPWQRARAKQQRLSRGEKSWTRTLLERQCNQSEVCNHTFLADNYKQSLLFTLQWLQQTQIMV